MLERLRGVTSHRWGWKAKCPAHDDRNASLSVFDRDGDWRVKCHAGCSRDQIFSAIGWDPQKPTDGMEIVKTYDYLNVRGKLAYQQVRFEPKTFRPRYKLNGEWIWGLPRGNRYPFNLQSLLSTPKKGVIICEGEKDACSLIALGYLATCFVSNHFHEDYAPFFNHRYVCILPDNDDPGIEYAVDWWLGVEPVAKETKLLRLPDLAKGQDVSDWLKTHSPRELDSLIRQAPLASEDPLLSAARLFHQAKKRPFSAWYEEEYRARGLGK